MNVAIVGSTGLVGRMFLRILEERNFTATQFTLFASQKSDGTAVKFFEKTYKVKTLSHGAVKDEKFDLAFFFAGADVSREYAKDFIALGATVIDNSSAFRLFDGVPLLIPEVNPFDLKKHSKIIANPNCSTVLLALVLKPLDDAFGLKRVVVSTYQAVSGAGKRGIDDLINGGASLPPEKFPCRIYSNCIPQIDSFCDDGYTKEELKLVNETRKILHRPDLKITATAVRVSVFNTHAESVNIELDRSASLDDVLSVLKNAKGVTVKSGTAYPTAIDADGKDNVFIGRIRRDFSAENAFNLWIVGDNLKKGAALNAVQIAELLTSTKN